MCFRPSEISLPTRCPECGTMNDPGVEVCKKCGADLPKGSIPGAPGASAAPVAPGAPKAPGAPVAPGAPKAPGAPAAPGAPKAPGSN